MQRKSTKKKTTIACQLELQQGRGVQLGKRTLPVEALPGRAIDTMSIQKKPRRFLHSWKQ